MNLIGKATIGPDDKTVAPPGTAEAFQKYLELDPNGPLAEPAKDMLASIGAHRGNRLRNNEEKAGKEIA